MDENVIAREKGRTATAERKAQEQATRANREEQRANKAENRLSMMKRFVRQAGASEAFDRWANLTAVIDKAIAAFNAWAHSRASIFSRDDERIIGQGIIAKCQLEGLNPVSETDRKTAASSIAEMAEESIGTISQFMWDTTVLRIGQLASKMRVSLSVQSVGGSNGNADELTNLDDTKKRGLGI
ncbi:MAG: hypothetical protein J6A02_11850 [Prevotella sp.]|nr:hypothetical protein [Prevotella sp.]